MEDVKKVEWVAKDVAVNKIRNSNGKIFSVKFVKKDGSLRDMNCRLGVVKYVKGIGRKFDPADYALVGVYDLQKEAYRMINLNKLLMLKMEGMTYHTIPDDSDLKIGN